MITTEQGNHWVTRNSSYFEKTNFKPLLHGDPDNQDTFNENYCELVRTGGEENNSTSSPKNMYA